MADSLPLFPLGTVLFPGARLPLHVFELRYRRLVHGLVRHADEQPEFGIVAIREGLEVGAHGARSLHPIGCTAELIGVAPLDDGGFDIMTRGVRRFRIVRVHPPEPEQPDRAEVEFPDEAPSPRSRDLAETATRLFRRFRRDYLLRSGFDPQSRFTIPEDPVACSYLLAATVPLDLLDRQQLLAAPTVDDRLTMVATFLRRETALLGRLSSRAGEELFRGNYSPN